MSGESCRLKKSHITCGPSGPSTIKNFLVRSQLFLFTFFYHGQLRILNTLETVVSLANGYCIWGNVWNSCDASVLLHFLLQLTLEPLDHWQS
jgi:hypothetical protein